MENSKKIVVTAGVAAGVYQLIRYIKWQEKCKEMKKGKEFAFEDYLKQRKVVDMRELLFALLTEGKNVFFLNDNSRGKLASYFVDATDIPMLKLSDDNEQILDTLINCSETQHIVFDNDSMTAGILMKKCFDSVEALSYREDYNFDIVKAVNVIVEMGYEDNQPVIRNVFLVESFGSDTYVLEKIAHFDGEKHQYVIDKAEYCL